MRNLRAAAVATVLVLAGAVFCGGVFAVPSHKKVTADDYVASDPDSPIRAFIYADHTVVQLDSYKSALSIVDDSGGTISYTEDGKFATLPARLNHFTAYINGRGIEFTRSGWTPPRVIKIASAEGIAPGVTLDVAGSEGPSTPTRPKTANTASAVAGAPAVPTAAHTAKFAGVPPLLTAAALGAASAPAASIASARAAAASTPTAASAPSLAVASVTVPGTEEKPTDPAQQVQTWQIDAGQPIGATLVKWGKRVNWNVDWKYPRDIIAPSSVTYTGDFITVSSKVISTLHEDGALIYTHFYTEGRYQRIWKSGAIAESDE
jgi:hypothetical protein